MRAVLFANGMIDQESVEHLTIRTDDIIVSVDGGFRHVQALDINPHIIIGDMDSIDSHHLPNLEEQGVEIHRFPPAKDETDLELALHILRNRGYDECLIIGALGGRIDQTLANIWMMASESSTDFSISLDDGCEHIVVILDETTINGDKGDLLSLIPFGGPVQGIVTNGLAYPLQDEALYPEKTRGLSNVLLGNQAKISIRSGKLLCVHRRASACKKEL